MSYHARMTALVVLGALLLTFAANWLGLLRPLGYYGQDLVSRTLQERVSTDVVIVEIDSYSIRELETWPWSRGFHGALIDKLNEAGARRIFYDVDFSSRSDPAGNRALTAAVRRIEKDRLVLPVFWQASGSGDEQFLLSTPMEPLDELATLGSVNVMQSEDGRVRSVRRAWQLDDFHVYGAAMRLARQPESSERPILIDYSIDPASFDYVSFADLLGGNVPESVIRDKTVLVGATAVELGDMLPVPLHQSLPGVVVQALAYASLERSELRHIPVPVIHVALAIWVIVLAALQASLRWWLGLPTLLALVASLFFVACHLQLEYGLLLDASPFLVSAGCVFVLATLGHLEASVRRLIRTLRALSRQQALFSTVVESSSEAIITVDAKGQIAMQNRAAARMFGLDDEDGGRHIGELIPELGPEFWASLRSEPSGGAVALRETLLLNGTEQAVEYSISPVDDEGEQLYTAIIRDVSERHRARVRLEFQATHDALTRLPNRRALLDRLEADAQKIEEKGGYALLMLDLNRFKEINDAMGHATGDDVLREVSKRLAHVLEHRHFIARLGGDEFAVIVQEPGAEAPQAVAETLLAAMEQPVNANGIVAALGVSIGIALATSDNHDSDTLLKQADIAMYSAKRQGAGVEFYEQNERQDAVRRLLILGRLRHAIDAGEIQLQYQPQIRAETGKMEAVEALVRWEDDELGRITPDEFIEAIEATDLLKPFSMWSLDAAIAQIAAWRDEGRPLRVAVNLSARMLQDVDFPREVAERLAAVGIGPDLLELEITESALMVDHQRALETLLALDAIGVSLSVDDFGTGFSSLAYLRDLPVHAIKIDKSFVQNMEKDAGCRSIVKCTVQMAKALDLEVVAEGVETEWQLNHIKKLRCDWVQGYYYSPALPADELLEWERARTGREELLPA